MTGSTRRGPSARYAGAAIAAALAVLAAAFGGYWAYAMATTPASLAGGLLFLIALAGFVVALALAAFAALLFFTARKLAADPDWEG